MARFFHALQIGLSAVVLTVARPDFGFTFVMIPSSACPFAGLVIRTQSPTSGYQCFAFCGFFGFCSLDLFLNASFRSFSFSSISCICLSILSFDMHRSFCVENFNFLTV